MRLKGKSNVPQMSSVMLTRWTILAPILLAAPSSLVQVLLTHMPHPTSSTSPNTLLMMRKSYRRVGLT